MARGGSDHAILPARTNLEHYERLLTGDTTRILFTNGSFDPWSELSIVTDPQDASSRNVYSYVIEGGFHSSDLMYQLESDSKSLIGARQRFQDLVTRWLAN